MTIRLEEINKFRLLEPGTMIVLRGELRRVRLELNCQFPTQIMVDNGEDSPRFLVNVEGRETVEFVAEGPTRLHMDSEGQVWWWTSELESSAVEPSPEAVNYTTIAEREARDPRMERYVALVNENARVREAQIMEALRATQGEVAALRQEAAANAAKRPKPTAPPAGQQPAGEGQANAAPAAGGSDGGDAGGAADE